MEQRLHHQFTRAAVQLDGQRDEFAAAFLAHQTRPAGAVNGRIKIVPAAPACAVTSGRDITVMICSITADL